MVRLVEVQESKAEIVLIADLPEDGKLSTSFRLLAVPGKGKSKLSFLSRDLVADGGRRIDRSQLKVAAPETLGSTPRDLTLAISSVVVPGDYHGTIEIRATGVAGVQRIPVHLIVQKPAPPAFAPGVSGLTLRLANWCEGVTQLVLEAAACREQFSLPLAAKGRTADPVRTTVTLIGADGADAVAAAVGEGRAISAEVKDSSLVLSLPLGALGPGHYGGTIRAVFDSGATTLDAPVQIDVRWPSSLAFFFIALGVGVGRIQAYMTSTGNSVAAANSKLRWMRARAARLHPTYVAAFDVGMRRAFDLLDTQEITDLTTELAQLGKAILALEDLSVLVPDPDLVDPSEATALKSILTAVRVGDGDAAETEVAALRASRNAQAGLAVDDAQDDGTSAAAGKRLDEGRTKWVVRLRGLLFWVTLLFVSLAGLHTLYVSNGAQLGASPLADFLTLFAWGLASDVAGRTLANFMGER